MSRKRVFDESYERYGTMVEITKKAILTSEV
jgi:hypothetical protein